MGGSLDPYREHLSEEYGLRELRREENFYSLDLGEDIDLVNRVIVEVIKCTAASFIFSLLRVVLESRPLFNSLAFKTFLSPQPISKV